MIKLFLITLLLLPCFFLFTSPVRAEIITSKDQPVTISQDQVIDDDLFITADSLTINGTINGDLFAAAGNINFTGTVNGSLYAAGGTINISGTVKNDLLLAGGNLDIRQAQVGESLITFGGNVNIDNQTSVGGSLIFGAGSYSSQAPVSRGVLGGAGNLNLDGPIGKNVRISAGQITLGPQTRISGNLSYAVESESDFSLSPTATVSGQLKRLAPQASQVKEKLDRQLPRLLSGIKTGLKIWSFFAALLVGAIILYLFPQPAQSVANQLHRQLAASLGWGLIVVFLTPVVTLTLMLTGIGLPLGLILILLFFIELYLTKIFVGLCFGNWLAKKFNFQNLSPYLIFTLGLLGIYFITSLPFIGFLARIIVTLLGFGALFLSKKHLPTSLRK
jgi:cytoskeletal protein CcmA (bactofilin family)